MLALICTTNELLEMVCQQTADSSRSDSLLTDFEQVIPGHPWLSRNTSRDDDEVCTRKSLFNAFLSIPLNPSAGHQPSTPVEASMGS